MGIHLAWRDLVWTGRTDKQSSQTRENQRELLLTTSKRLELACTRGSTWRERVTRMRTRITLIFDNFPQSSTFCENFTSKFRSVYADCQRLQEIVKDSSCTFANC